MFLHRKREISFHFITIFIILEAKRSRRERERRGKKFPRVCQREKKGAEDSLGFFSCCSATVMRELRERLVGGKGGCCSPSLFPPRRRCGWSNKSSQEILGSLRVIENIVELKRAFSRARDEGRRKDAEKEKKTGKVKTWDFLRSAFSKSGRTCERKNKSTLLSEDIQRERERKKCNKEQPVVNHQNFLFRN